MKDLILGLLIGTVIGLWFGVNLGKDQPLLTNPFVNKSDIHEFSEKFDALQKDVKKKSQILYQDVKKAVDKTEPVNSNTQPAEQQTTPTY